MGISCMSSSSYDTPSYAKRTIINPYSFKVLGVDTCYRPYCIVLLKYDCDSFDGLKLTVYDCMDIENQILNRSEIDPHFSEFHPEISPIARFRPTKEGYRQAMWLSNHLHNILPVEQHNNTTTIPRKHLQLSTRTCYIMTETSNDKIPVKAGQLYKHYKGNYYRVLAVGIYTEYDNEDKKHMVVYHEENNPDSVWIRPLWMFTNRVELADNFYSMIKEVNRFTLIEEE
jgi:hypothetical protein